MLDQGSLTEGEGSVQLTSLFRLAPFCIENIIYVCYKTSYLKEEVNCTEPFPLVSIPCLGNDQETQTLCEKFIRSVKKFTMPFSSHKNRFAVYSLNSFVSLAILWKIKMFLNTKRASLLKVLSKCFIGLAPGKNSLTRLKVRPFQYYEHFYQFSQMVQLT